MRDLVSWEIASFVLLALGCSAWEWLRPGWRVDRLAGLKLDLVSFAVAVVFALVSREILAATRGGFPPVATAAWVQSLRSLPFAAKLLIGLLLVDFTIYWVHRVQHAVALAWRSHRWHHSAEQMYWLAGFRTSFLHSFVYNIPQTVVPMHLLELSPLECGIGYSIGLFVQFWDHTNARGRIGCLKYLLVRPQDHRLHHAAGPGRVVNFGFVFSLWDRCFGTYADGDRAEDYALGLGECVDPRSVPRMMLGV